MKLAPSTRHKNMIDKANQLKPNSTPVLFVNWSNEEYIGRWDGEDIVIDAGGTKWVPFWLAEHLANHLVDRELNKLQIPTDHHTRDSYMRKCIGNEAQLKASASNSDPLGLEALNAEMANVQPEKTAKPANRGGRPKKVVVVNDATKDEDSFEGK